MPAQADRLRAEITADPAGLGYAGTTDKQALALLTAPTRSIVRDVPVSELEAEILLGGMMMPLEQVAASSPAYGAAQALLGLIRSPRLQTLEYSDPAKKAVVDRMLGGLEAAGVLTTAQAGRLRGMGQATVSRAQEPGLVALTERDIQDARAI